MSAHPITILGTGIAGLTLSQCLLKRGIPFHLYDRSPTPARNNYAITLYASTYRALCKELGISERVFLERPSKPTTNSPTSPSPHPPPRNPLRNTSTSQTPPEIHTPGLVIAADGVHSAARAALLPAIAPQILPYVAFNGRRELSNEVFEELYAAAFASSPIPLAIAHKIGDALLSIALVAQTANTTTLSWTYSRPAPPADPCFNPTRPVSSATQIPEASYAELAQLQALPQPFRDVFDGEKVRGERVLHWLMRALLVPSEELTKLAGKGVVLVGDAGHAEAILGGEGANGAVGDAVGLAGWIEENGVEGVERWCGERYGAWEEGVGRSRDRITAMHGEAEGKAVL
ncbi:uncharacterized protein BDZ99DRAFT_499443 [Mytilinidion resinicola]|uniref:FAD/NAD(P)-binding domain-containing protein n=1 Tax=Mytilinidion resinicola TaxID=574789 RepID=A0A6A6YKS3_9PEZI|nr:uncharacterized protein BDZ99DRAFT_499443 [Mytilinidion resinicola]KAF2809153.1 hypothetical protein BDZ99DRAFT_499443 [Mytilinidion resinicola]